MGVGGVGYEVHKSSTAAHTDTAIAKSRSNALQAMLSVWGYGGRACGECTEQLEGGRVRGGGGREVECLGGLIPALLAVAWRRSVDAALCPPMCWVNIQSLPTRLLRASLINSGRPFPSCPPGKFD